MFDKDVLVVDDSLITRQLLLRILRGLGFTRIQEAKNGADALERLSAPGSSIGLVLLDWTLPLMTGPEVLAELRTSATLARIPVIMVSAEAAPARIACLIAGAVPHTPIAMWMILASYPLYATFELAPRVYGFDARSDQQVAGGIMILLGGLFVLGMLTAIFMRWQGTGTEVGYGFSPKVFVSVTPDQGGFWVDVRLWADLSGGTIVLLVLFWMFFFPAAIIYLVMGHSKWQSYAQYLMHAVHTPDAHLQGTPGWAQPLQRGP